MSLTFSQRRPYYFPGPRIPEQSLVDLSLKSITRTLNNESLECFPEASNLPIRLKQLLLKYIAAYRTRGVTADELQTFLGMGNKDECYLASSQIRDLDLSGSIGSSLTFDELNVSRTTPSDLVSLTHLCLARPGADVSWPSFLCFAIAIPSLTHLSLAYWPKPSANTSTSLTETSSPNSTLALYRLSESFKNLQYLDVEGCSDWVPELGIQGGADWASNWQKVHSVNFSQGSMPIEVQFEGGPETETWLQREFQARQVEEFINGMRKSHGRLDIPPLRVERGWNPQNTFLRIMIEMAWDKVRERLPDDCSRRPA